jgi:hypothetical protein
VPLETLPARPAPASRAERRHDPRDAPRLSLRRSSRDQQGYDGRRFGGARRWRRLGGQYTYSAAHKVCHYRWQSWTFCPRHSRFRQDRAGRQPQDAQNPEGLANPIEGIVGCCALAASGHAAAAPPSSVMNWRRLRSGMGSSPEPAVPAYRRLRMARKRPQVLGVDLNRSESSQAGVSRLYEHEDPERIMCLVLRP